MGIQYESRMSLLSPMRERKKKACTIEQVGIFADRNYLNQYTSKLFCGIFCEPRTGERDKRVDTKSGRELSARIQD